MSLPEAILTGIQTWYKATVKDLTRARGSSKKVLGQQLASIGCPQSLSEARELLLQFRETGGERVRSLLQAIACVESRVAPAYPDGAMCKHTDAREDSGRTVCHCDGCK